ncbi:hypothetical protein TWF225_007919 [Orbilia oligospora]|nr:hypothetical protein TWF225_007919 [Orbilia oligospora]KAF3260231.1 hypothetical protein TWF128_003692 [Orbilia oligospora]KAF3272520.1 hypothetical protein TWF217_000014 [Orbilia oligospora]KAF3292037.1 hypothetical protein TWF132_006280 [Orbilia oligospora]
MPPTVTLSTVPPELVHGICDYLSDQDFLKLQLVSAALYSKLPHSRLDKIHSRRMVRFTDTETRKLKRLASNRPEKLSRINHLVFNLTSPHVRFIPEHLFSHWANSYSWSIRMKMLKFYHNYRERNPSERKREVIEVPQLEPGSEQLPPGQDLRPEYLLAFFSILKSIIQPPPKFDQKALFGALTEVLKLLPNLQTIEFMEDYLHPRDRHLIGLLLEEYNPSLKAFVQKNPDLEELPWVEWLRGTDNQIRFDTAYSTALFCAVVAGCRRITEIKVNRMRFITCYDTTVSLSRFSTYDTNSVSIPPSLLTKQRYEAAYLDHYQRAFESLRRLEIWCSGVELDKPEKVSPLFLTTIQNVQELSFRRPLDYKNIYFIKLPNTLLLNLRRLEIISARVDLNSLQDFARTNKNSLRELILQGPCNDDMRKPEIIGFLETMRRIIDLEICQIDFVTHRKQMVGACFLLVDVKGSWREEGVACRYRVGSRCADRDERFEPRDGADWVEQQTWKEFIIEIKEVGASGLVPRYQRSMSDECMDCQDHWRRDRTW